MGREWKCTCKDCGAEFSYSDTKYEAGRVRGHLRPERCDKCRAQHAREIQSVGQAYYKVKALKPVGDPRRLTSDLGRFDREERPHEAEDTQPAPIDPNKFGIRDDRLVELFHFFKQDPGLQVVVVVGPTGSGKSTYFPYRLVELPETYETAAGEQRDTYWTVPIETDADLDAAREAVRHTRLEKGHHRHYTSPPDDPRASAHKVSGSGGLDPRMFWRYGQIVVTQPRIQATRSIPEFIAKAMMGCKLGAGHDVGFRHSGAPNSDWSSKLAFVTDGTLINWIAKGELDKINTLMIDEAHERSLNIDIIIGMLTQLLPRHPRLRLIIASATIAADKFIDHFNRHLPRRTDAAGNVLPNCRLMEFEGKSYKVTPHFRLPNEPPLDYYREGLSPAPDGAPRWEGRHRKPSELPAKVAEKVDEILKEMYSLGPGGGYLNDHNGQPVDITERQGDVLVFLHGEAPIQECCQRVEKAAREALGDKVKLRALPIYTSLKQSEQDEVLKEREQPHGTLFKKLVEHLSRVEAGKTPPSDVLAILNNAGQIHNLCTDLEKRVAAPTVHVKRGKEELEEPNSLLQLKGKVEFVPWFTPETARQLFEAMPERADLKVPPPRPGVMRVVISTTRHRTKLGETFPTVIELPPEERRVVVSTNVAETSLTIHGILHVVDSGLINQNKWDPATQTSAVSPILQSRAGCKQRWGRAGRLQAGDAWLLYTEAQFGKEQGEADDDPARVFDFYSRPEIARSPLEQVLLTAKKAGVESLDPGTFPWLDAPDVDELSRSVRSLEQKGALDPDGDLTAHGVELGGMVGLDARVGNMLVIADRFACAVEMATAVAVAAEGLKRLLEFDRRWDEASALEVRRRQSAVLAGCRDDLDAALRLVACWEEVQAAGEAFAATVRLAAYGDELDREAAAAPRTAAGDKVRRLIADIRQAGTEEEVGRLVDTLTMPIRDRQRQRELRAAAATSFTTSRAFWRLGGAWRAVVNAWSFPKVWDEAVTVPLAASRLLLRNHQAADRESLTAALADFFPKYRAAVGRGGAAAQACRDELARTVGPALRENGNLIDFLAGLADPVFAQEPAQVSDALASLPHHLRRPAADALAQLPEAAARAWARANYLMPEALAAVQTARAKLLGPLEAHKKGAEYRPLDLTRTNRLRALIAHSLPENAYRLEADGAYYPVLPSPATEPLDVEPEAASVCAASPPDLFVCVERRAAPAVEGRRRKLFASFLIALPADWATAMADAALPLHKMSPARLGRFFSERCKTDSRAGRDLLADTVFPRTASCRVKVQREAGPGLWEVVAEPPHLWPAPVVVRAKKAAEEGRLEVDVEDVIRSPYSAPTDLQLTRHQRNLKAGEAVEESIGQIDPAQWEALFRAGPDPAAASAGGAVVVIGDRVPRPVAAVAGIPAILAADGPFQPEQVVVAEVTTVATTEAGARVPHLRYPTGADQLERLIQMIGRDDLGKLFELTVIRVERLALDAGAVLIACEAKSGCEVSFGPRDLSFSWCGEVPELVARHLPPGSRFIARLVQVDPESGRLRMTTHHVFDTLYPDPKGVTGKQPVEVLLATETGPFVRIVRDDHPERQAFTLIAKLSCDQLRGEPVGSRHDVYLSHPSRTRESWSSDMPAPATLRGDASTTESVVVSGPVMTEKLVGWLDEVGDRRTTRSALYSLYERSHQLSGMEEDEHARWCSLLNQTVKAWVTKTSKPGVDLDLDGYPGVPGWLPREEYTWTCDETLADLKVGDQLLVKGREVDLDRRQVVMSRRWLTPNPYLGYVAGRVVMCKVRKSDSNGAELFIDQLRLRGWVFRNQIVQLPWESFDGQFDAVVLECDSEVGKLTVSRWPLVQKRLREVVGGAVLRTRFVELQRRGNEVVGARVELAAGLLAFLPAGEVTWKSGRGEGSRALEEIDRRAAEGCRDGRVVEVEVVLLPQEQDPKKWNNLRVSRKRAWAAEFRLAGTRNLFFGKSWSNVQAEVAACADLGPAGVDALRDAPEGHLLIGGDTRKGFEMLVSRLTALAGRTRCTLSQIGQIPVGPLNLVHVSPTNPIKPAIPTPLPTKPPEPSELAVIDLSDDYLANDDREANGQNLSTETKDSKNTPAISASLEASPALQQRQDIARDGAVGSSKPPSSPHSARPIPQPTGFQPLALPGSVPARRSSDVTQPAARELQKSPAASQSSRTARPRRWNLPASFKEVRGAGVVASLLLVVAVSCSVLLQIEERIKLDKEMARLVEVRELLEAGDYRGCINMVATIRGSLREKLRSEADRLRARCMNKSPDYP